MTDRDDWGRVEKAELLRRAAGEIRDALGFSRQDREFHLAVAAWLEFYASTLARDLPIAFEGQAVAVADAFLDERAPDARPVPLPCRVVGSKENNMNETTLLAADDIAADHGHWCAEGFPDADAPGRDHFVCACGLPWTLGEGCVFVAGVRAALHSHLPNNVGT